MVDTVIARNGTCNQKPIVLSTVVVDPSPRARFTARKEHGGWLGVSRMRVKRFRHPNSVLTRILLTPIVFLFIVLCTVYFHPAVAKSFWQL